MGLCIRNRAVAWRHGLGNWFHREVYLMTKAHTQPVAWRVMNGFGHWYITQDKALADTYRDTEKKDVQPLYLAAQPPAAPVEPYAWVIPGDDQSRPSGSVDAMAWREGEFTKPLYAQMPAAPVETKHSPDECGRECQYYDYFEMLWRWFADESRNGAEDMRANVANGGLSADDFKQMLDDHEANLIPTEPQGVSQSSVETAPVAWRWRSIFNETAWALGDKEPPHHEQFITEPLYTRAAPQTSPKER